jgi:hypothetical protein
MKKNWQAIAIVILFSATALAFRGCDDKQQKQLRDLIHVGAAGAVEVREQVKDLCRAELIKPESCEKAQPHTEKIADVAQRIDKFSKEHPQQLTAENKQEFLALADDLLKELDALEGEGLIEFKTPDDRRKFLLYVALGKSGIRIARQAIADTPVAEPSPSPSQ